MDDQGISVKDPNTSQGKEMEYLEGKQDVSDAKKAIKEIKRHGVKTLEQLAKELGIDIY